MAAGVKFGGSNPETRGVNDASWNSPSQPKSPSRNLDGSSKTQQEQGKVIDYSIARVYQRDEFGRPTGPAYVTHETPSGQAFYMPAGQNLGNKGYYPTGTSYSELRPMPNTYAVSGAPVGKELSDYYQRAPKDWAVQASESGAAGINPEVYLNQPVSREIAEKGWSREQVKSIYAKSQRGEPLTPVEQQVLRNFPTAGGGMITPSGKTKEMPAAGTPSNMGSPLPPNNLPPAANVEYQIKEFKLPAETKIEQGSLPSKEVYTMGVSASGLQAGWSKFLDVVDKPLKASMQAADVLINKIQTYIPKVNIINTPIGRGLNYLADKNIPIIGRLTAPKDVSEEDFEKSQRLSAFGTGAVIGLAAPAATFRALGLTLVNIGITETIARPTIDVAANAIGGPQEQGWTARGALGTGISLLGRGLIYGGLVKAEQNLFKPDVTLKGFKGQVQDERLSEGQSIERVKVKTIFGEKDAGIIASDVSEVRPYEEDLSKGFGEVNYVQASRNILGQAKVEEGSIQYSFKEPVVMTAKPTEGEYFLNGVDYGVNAKVDVLQIGLRNTYSEEYGNMQTKYAAALQKQFEGVTLDSGKTGTLYEGAISGSTTGSKFDSRFLDRLKVLNLQGEEYQPEGHYGGQLESVETKMSGGVKEVLKQESRQAVLKSKFAGETQASEFRQAQIGFLGTQQVRYAGSQETVEYKQQGASMFKPLLLQQPRAIQMQESNLVYQMKEFKVGALTTPVVTPAVKQEQASVLSYQLGLFQFGKLTTPTSLQNQASIQEQVVIPSQTPALSPAFTSPLKPSLPFIPLFGAGGPSGGGGFAGFSRSTKKGLRFNPIARPNAALRRALGLLNKKIKSVRRGKKK